MTIQVFFDRLSITSFVLLFLLYRICEPKVNKHVLLLYLPRCLKASYCVNSLLKGVVRNSQFV